MDCLSGGRLLRAPIPGDGPVDGWVPESAQLNSGCPRLHLWFSSEDRAGVYYRYGFKPVGFTCGWPPRIKEINMSSMF